MEEGSEKGIRWRETGGGGIEQKPSCDDKRIHGLQWITQYGVRLAYDRRMLKHVGNRDNRHVHVGMKMYMVWVLFEARRFSDFCSFVASLGTALWGKGDLLQYNKWEAMSIAAA